MRRRQIYAQRNQMPVVPPDGGLSAPAAVDRSPPPVADSVTFQQVGEDKVFVFSGDATQVFQIAGTDWAAVPAPSRKKLSLKGKRDGH